MADDPRASPRDRTDVKHSVAGLSELLDLTQVDQNAWQARADNLELPQLFGGQLIAQSVVAAGRTAGPGAQVSSVHAIFLRPGTPGEDVRLEVNPLRVGRTIQTFEVRAVQGGRLLSQAMVSSTTQENGVEHRRAHRKAPTPEESIDLRTVAEPYGGLGAYWAGFETIEIRVAPPVRAESPQLACSIDNVWMRSVDPLPDDPLLHRAVVAYASDLMLMSTALRPHGVPIGDDASALRNWSPVSLDHSLWFHDDCRADDWLLFQQGSAGSYASRALVRANVVDRAGRSACHVAQEALVRPLNQGEQP